MEPFLTLESTVAPMLIANVDTDMIIPKEYLKTLERTGLGKFLFYEMRYDNDGNEIADFILNKPNFKSSNIILAGENFGCGSSREHAPWALKDFGIRCIIAPSFADIFYGNCIKNSILPITLPPEPYQKIVELVKNSANPISCNISLEDEIIKLDSLTINFCVSPAKKEYLLTGLDDIGITLKKVEQINAFEKMDAERRSWIHSKSNNTNNP